MRSLRLTIASLLGMCAFAACNSQDTGLLDLTLTSDAQNPPPQAVAIDLIGSGGIHRSYPSKFPPDGATFLRLEYPDLPTGTVTFTVQTLDSKGCVLGESPAPFAVAIQAGARVTASTTIQRSTKPCGDGGGPAQGFDAWIDAGRADDLGGFDGGAVPVDSPIDVAASVDAGVDAPVVDAPFADAPSTDAPSFDAQPADRPSDVASVDSFQAVDAPANGADAPAGPVIVSFIASPATISAGSAATLTAVFKNATGSSVDHGIGSVTSGNGVGTGALTTTTTYKLTVIDAAGSSVSQQVTVTIVPRPSITSFTSLLPTIAVGTLTQLTGTFTGGTGSIDNNIGSVSSGAPVPTGVLAANATFTLTVANAAGDSATKQATVATSAAVGTGVFTATGSMTVARSQHTATLLPNGKVLVAGGDTLTNMTSSSELYDPIVGTFATTGSMTVGRAIHTATLLPNGKVLMVGGSGASGPTATAELYDPATGAFSATGAMGATRDGSHTATLLANGKVLVAGGGGEGLGESGYLSSAEIYDPAKGTFTPAGKMSNPRMYMTANLLPNGKVLIAGGMNITNIPPKGYVTTADLWDPSTGLFTPTGPLFYGRCAHTSVSLPNGDVLIVGGVGDGGPALFAELYDPAKGAFSVSGAESDERYRHTTTLLPNGNVLVAGGYYSTDTELATSDVYTPSNGRFIAGGTMTTGRGLHTATLLPNGSVLVTGGIIAEGGSSVSSAELYW